MSRQFEKTGVVRRPRFFGGRSSDTSQHRGSQNKVDRLHTREHGVTFQRQINELKTCGVDDVELVDDAVEDLKVPSFALDAVMVT